MGTKLPWDPQFLIESLSDSTIYMAYYTIAHLLQGDFYGHSVGPAGVKPEQLTHEVFDYIFLSQGEGPKPTNVPEHSLEQLRREFEYWYPLDLRVSGKDLVQNHLTFFLYNHLAIFPEKHWPKGVRANGHLLLDDNKMSKSEGNFLTIFDSILQFGSDATRFTLAEAGDGFSDANFKTDIANKRVTQVFQELQWIKEMVEHAKQGKFREGPQELWMDKVFGAEISHSIKLALENYDSACYRMAVNASWHTLTAARDVYRRILGEKVHKDLIFKYIRTLALLNAPVIPHFAEKVWELLGNTSLIVAERFPQVEEVDETLLASKNHLFESIHELRKRQAKTDKGKKKLRVYVAKSFPEYIVKAFSIISSFFDSEKKVLKADRKVVLNAVNSDPLVKQHSKDVTKLIPFVLSNLEKSGDLNAVSCSITFDEFSLFESNKSVICSELEIEEVQVVAIEDKETAELKPSLKTISSVRPYYPQFTFY